MIRIYFEKGDSEQPNKVSKVTGLVPGQDLTIFLPDKKEIYARRNGTSCIIRYISSGEE